MIFITHFGNSKAAKDYLSQHLSKGDYFAKDAERLKPTWEGKTAEHLGLEGEQVTQKDFFSICDNVNPVTGERLTPRTKQERRAMTDLTFDASKSVTLVALVDSRVKTAINEAVDETMRELERDAATRVRKDGKDEDRVTGNLIWSMWTHDTSRPLADGTVDPQEHRHVTVMNVTYDPVEKQLKAVQLGNVVRDKGYYQSAYHARLAGKLSALGYGIERDGNSFRIAGVSEELCDKFSRRHGVIDAAADARGITSPEGRAKLAKVTRNRKGDELSTAELKAEWFSRMTAEEVRSLKDARNRKPERKGNGEESLNFAVEHIFQRVSTESEAKLKGEALRHGVGSVLPDEIDVAFKKRTDLILVNKDGQRMVTTKDTLNGEIRMLKSARDGRGQYAPLGDVAMLPDNLSAEQGKAAAMILQSRDRVTGIIGGAGTGKTTTLKAVVQGIEQQGKSVIRVAGYAPSSSASRKTLREEAKIKDADTLATLLTNQKMQESIRGQVLLVDEAGMISTKDMNALFQVAEKQNARIILSGDYHQHGSVDAGDSFRILESEGGVKYARLTEIRRQTNATYKNAVESIAKGSRQGVQKGFDILDKSGSIVAAQGDERHRLLVNDYLQAIAEKKWVGTGKARKLINKDALIIAPTHKEGDKLTSELRSRMKENGTLGVQDRTFITRKNTGWTDAQKKDARLYEKGMVVEFNQNAKGGFRRGEVGVVAGVVAGKVQIVRQDGSYANLPDAADRFQVYNTQQLGIAKGDRIRITKNGTDLRKKRLNNGDILTVEGFELHSGNLKLSNGTLLPKSYGHIAMGYVDTSYASQGKTVDRVYIAAGDASLLAVNSQQWYVSVSRGRESAKVYVNDKQEIRDAIARSGKRLSAVEMVGGTDFQEPPKITPVRERTISPMRARLNQMVERNRVLSYVRDRAVVVRNYFRERQGVSLG